MKASTTQLQKWAFIRKNGKRHYAITRGLLGIGLPLLATWLIYRLCFNKVLESGNVYVFLGELCAFIPGTLFFGYYNGNLLWDIREKEFLDACPDGNLPDLESAPPQQ